MKTADYNELNELLLEYSKINSALEKSEAGIKTVQLVAAETLLPEYAELKMRFTQVESRLRKLADAYYDELFPEEKKRTHQTPFGGVKYHKSSSLEFEDEEKVVLKIRAECAKEMRRAERAEDVPHFTEEKQIRTYERPNLEALDEFDDGALTNLFGITRKHKDNFKVIPFELKSDKPAKKDKPLKEAA
jgi:anion-transporting  ArsA/GET3 family ATPase